MRAWAGRRARGRVGVWAGSQVCGLRCGEQHLIRARGGRVRGQLLCAAASVGEDGGTAGTGTRRQLPPRSFLRTLPRPHHAPPRYARRPRTPLRLHAAWTPLECGWSRPGHRRAVQRRDVRRQQQGAARDRLEARVPRRLRRRGRWQRRRWQRRNRDGAATHTHTRARRRRGRRGEPVSRHPCDLLRARLHPATPARLRGRPRKRR